MFAWYTLPMTKRLLSLVVLVGTCVPALVFARVPNDPDVRFQWYLDQIAAYEAWDTATGGDVVVAVLDTGMDITHPDLAANIFVNAGEIAGDGLDNDGNGFVDDVNGWDFTANDNNPTPGANSGDDVGVHHATIVAGVIGAVGDNNEGIAGVTWDVEILPVQVLTTIGNGTTDHIVDGIHYAIDMGADVINMSFVGDTPTRGLDRALQRAYDNGVIVVTAMGNEDQNLDQFPLYPVCSTGLFDDNVAIGVVATDADDRRASFSNYGRNCADIAAPGIDIHTTQVEAFADAYGGGWNGTSLATPMVSGAAALVRSVYPNATPDEVRTAMQLSVDPVVGRAPSRIGGALGTGRLNITKLFETLPTIVQDQTTPQPEEEVTEAEEIETTEEAPVSSDVYDRPLAAGAAAGDAPYAAVDRGDTDPEWLAYAEGFRGGVDVAVGQLDDSGRYEIVTVPGAGGGPHVRVFTETGVLVTQFFAYDASNTDGLQVATGDTDGDGVDEIVIANGSRSEVRVFTMFGALLHTVALQDIVADVRVATGDIDGDGIDEIVVSQGPGSEPYVSIYELDGRRIAHYLVYGQTTDRGVFVSTVPYQGRDIVVTGTGDGAGPHVRLFNTIGALVSQYFAFDETDRDGVRVAGWQPFIDGEGYVVSSGYVDGAPALRLHDVAGELLDVSSDMSPFSDRVTIGGGL